MKKSPPKCGKFSRSTRGSQSRKSRMTRSLWSWVSDSRVAMQETEITSASKKRNAPRISQIKRDGFAIIPGVFAPDQVDAITSELARALAVGRAGVLEQAGRIYAARNILQ